MEQTVEQRVEIVIADSALSRGEFAATIGIDASKLSKSLAGRRRFSSLELARIAEVSRRSVDWLITGSAPFRPVFAQRARLAGANGEAGARVVEKIVAGVRGLGELDRPLVLPALPQLQRRSGLYTVEAPRLANAYTTVIGQNLGGTSTHELIVAIERLFGIVVVIADLPADIDGLSYEDDAARVVVLAPTNQPLRQRFTLAHELAHIAFGDARQGMLEERMWVNKSNEEKRANSFAAAFLAPAEEIRKFLDGRPVVPLFPALVERFQLSPDAMAWRLLNEKFVDESTCRALRGPSARSIYMQAGKAAEYHELASAAEEPRPGWLVVNAYLDAYRAGEITAKPIANLLDWAVADVEEFFALDDVGESGFVEG